MTKTMRLNYKFHFEIRILKHCRNVMIFGSIILKRFIFYNVFSHAYGDACLDFHDSLLQKLGFPSLLK